MKKIATPPPPPKKKPNKHKPTKPKITTKQNTKTNKKQTTKFLQKAREEGRDLICPRDILFPWSWSGAMDIYTRFWWRYMPICQWGRCLWIDPVHISCSSSFLLGVHWFSLFYQWADWPGERTQLVIYVLTVTNHYSHRMRVVQGCHAWGRDCYSAGMVAPPHGDLLGPSQVLEGPEQTLLQFRTSSRSLQLVTGSWAQPAKYTVRAK